MKALFYFFIFLFGISSAMAQTPDTLTTVRPHSTRVIQTPIMKSDKVSTVPAVRIEIFGDYTITGYSILSLKSPSPQQLDAMIGTEVKVDSTYISGASVDSISFTIFEVERLIKDDYIFRVFGRETKAIDQNLPDSFQVHKTDNANCYGIADLGKRKLAIPYKGVLLYLTKN